MSSRFINILFTGLRLLGIALVLIFLDSLLRYIIEVHEIIDVSPYSFPFVNKHPAGNVVGVFLYLSFLYLWYYFAAVALFHFTVKKIDRVTLGKSIASGIAVCFLFFIPYWGIAELFETAILLEGLVVYPILGIVMVFLHKLFLGKKKDKGEIHPSEA